MKNNNVYVIEAPNKENKVLLISDLHWDNPKCDRALLKKHLDEALAGGHDVIINGDMFCLMQGAFDPRKSKSDILPEHNHANYFDAIVNTAVEWFTPYAHLIKVIGYGNHETSILKRQETDIIERFVTLLNYKCGSAVAVGGYGGWVIWQFRPYQKSNNTKQFKLKYFHGSGGGGPVTRGTIQHNRMQVFVEGADAIWMGHVHEDYEMTYTSEYLSHVNTVKQRNILMIRTPTYKEEYGDGSKGWHVERGATPKPLGGRWLILSPQNKDGTITVNAYTHKTI
ncbi:metallophosphoesterase [Runella sp.]|uniref:metallophosphoesterase n=1 Tax=Runella sp. TaxID=1960881 RepID=UPI0030160A1E